MDTVISTLIYIKLPFWECIIRDVLFCTILVDIVRICMILLDLHVYFIFYILRVGDQTCPLCPNGVLASIYAGFGWTRQKKHRVQGTCPKVRNCQHPCGFPVVWTQSQNVSTKRVHSQNSAVLICPHLYRFVRICPIFLNNLKKCENKMKFSLQYQTFWGKINSETMFWKTKTK